MQKSEAWAVWELPNDPVICVRCASAHAATPSSLKLQALRASASLSVRRLLLLILVSSLLDYLANTQYTIYHHITPQT